MANDTTTPGHAEARRRPSDPRKPATATRTTGSRQPRRTTRSTTIVDAAQDARRARSGARRARCARPRRRRPARPRQPRLDGTGLTTKYSTRACVERELKRYERRGATARNRFERQVRKRVRASSATCASGASSSSGRCKQNRRRLERELSAVRKDLEKQSGTVTARVEKLVRRAGSARLTPSNQLPPPGAQESADSGRGSPAS